MAKWQPPIPAGALYSKAARALGPALPLLAYCYDLVQRDGWLELSLKDAAGDMDEAYPTVKRWWQTIADGPFFAEVQNHGRNGLRVRFKDIWIEWRILKARETPPEIIGTQSGSEMISNETDVANRDTIGIIIGTQSGSEMISQENVYGTHDSDQAKEIGGAKNSRTPSPKKKSDPPTPKPIREALADVCGIGRISTREQQLQLNQSAAQIWKEQERAGIDPEQVAANIRYVNKHWRATHWKGKKGDTPWPKDIREDWEPAMAARGKNGANGHIPGDLPLVTAGAQPTPEERRAAAERRRAILEEQRAVGK